MTEQVNGHSVKETYDEKQVNFTCVDCELESNFISTFKRESCN